MRRWSLWTAVLAAVLSAMVVSGLALAGGGKDAAPKDTWDGAETIVLVTRQTDDQVFTDVGEAGEGPGDTFTARDDLLDAKGAVKIGDGFINCVLQFGTPFVSQCDVVARLDGRGDIVLSGLVPATNDPFVIAVTGGTGEFRHVRGQALVEVVDEGPPLTQRVTLELRGVR
jgi:hypothetical protein